MQSRILTEEALSVKKWAFAADFIRLWAVYNEGGIYLDTDVKVYKSFDKFLHHSAFIGEEQYFHYNLGKIHRALGSHCFGAEKGNPFLKSCLDYYDGRHFITSHNDSLPIPLRYNQVILPYIQSEIARTYGFNWSVEKSEEIQLLGGLTVYPSQYFDNYHWAKGSSVSVCTHLTLGSWLEPTENEPDKKLSLKEKLFWKFILPHLRRRLKGLRYVIFHCD